MSSTFAHLKIQTDLVAFVGSCAENEGTSTDTVHYCLKKFDSSCNLNQVKVTTTTSMPYLATESYKNDYNNVNNDVYNNGYNNVYNDGYNDVYNNGIVYQIKETFFNRNFK